MLISGPKKIPSKNELLYDPKIRSYHSVGSSINMIRKQKASQGSFKVGFTNGAFRILTPVHCVLLSLARSKCDLLIVAINSDYSLRLLGREPPYSMQERAFALASLSVVDYVVPFDEETPYLCISSISPDIVFKGSDYKKEDVISAGVEVEIINLPFDTHASDVLKAKNEISKKYFKV